jgi:predicted transcriptional regulator
MNQRRNKDQIVAQILATCQEDGAIKTRIVYGVNLNFHTANVYLDLLLEKGLLETAEGDRTIYKTTLKGERALESLREVETIYS